MLYHLHYKYWLGQSPAVPYGVDAYELVHLL